MRVAVSADVDLWKRTWRAALVAAEADDATWNWIERVELGLSLEGHACLAAVSGNQLEGLLSLSIASARRDPGESLVYLEFLAVAPWNREGTRDRLRGLGTALVQVAIRVSLGLGYGGRIGLHSKPVSEPFYRKLGLLDLGAEVADDGKWVYFEATPDVARGLL